VRVWVFAFLLTEKYGLKRRAMLIADMLYT